MTTITGFDRTTMKALRAELDAALATVGARHGISIRTGNGSFLGPTATFKVELAVLRGGVAAAKDEGGLAYATSFGLSEKATLGAAFATGKRTYTIAGLRPGRRQPVLVTRDDGRQYWMGIEAVNAAIALTPHGLTAGEIAGLIASVNAKGDGR